MPVCKNFSSHFTAYIPRGGHLTMKFLHTPIPHFFDKKKQDPCRSLASMKEHTFSSAPHYHSSVHIRPNSTLKSPAMWKSLAPPSRPSPKPKSFSLMTSMSADVCLLILTEVSCQATSWQAGRSRDTRPVRQLELTTASKRASLNPIQMPEIIFGLIAHPSPARECILQPWRFTQKKLI